MIRFCIFLIFYSGFNIVFAQDFRPPAVPLITNDLYFSAWTFGNNLAETPVRHWTGREHGLYAVATVDGTAYRVIGTGKIPYTSWIPDGRNEAYPASYTFEKPQTTWTEPGFNDSEWKKGNGPFGTNDSGELVKTAWNTSDIWIRRTFQVETIPDLLRSAGKADEVPWEFP